MNTQTLTPSKIRKAGLDALTKELGPVGMVKFLQFTETGEGDYTKERKNWLNEKSVKEIVKQIKFKKKKKN
ncbi:MAG: hypothetical protein Q8K98_12115 [Bacteroidota bacterium]|nr:hypothetical protein [Bacteroidota bacterium]